jgi:hypothetical protein
MDIKDFFGGIFGDKPNGTTGAAQIYIDAKAREAAGIKVDWQEVAKRMLNERP